MGNFKKTEFGEIIFQRYNGIKFSRNDRRQVFHIILTGQYSILKILNYKKEKINLKIIEDKKGNCKALPKAKIYTDSLFHIIHIHARSQWYNIFKLPWDGEQTTANLSYA